MSTASGSPGCARSARAPPTVWPTLESGEAQLAQVATTDRQLGRGPVGRSGVLTTDDVRLMAAAGNAGQVTARQAARTYLGQRGLT